jgi:hypothetical protein
MKSLCFVRKHKRSWIEVSAVNGVLFRTLQACPRPDRSFHLQAALKIRVYNALQEAESALPVLHVEDDCSQVFL